MEILAGDVLFVWGDGLFDHAIEYVTHGPSHCALFINDTTLAEANAGRTIGECTLDDYLSRGGRLEVWGDPTLTDDDRAKLVEYAKSLYGVPYDYLLIPLEFIHFEFGAKIDWFREHHHRICSTYIYDAARHVGKTWAAHANPAPVDLLQYGALQLKGALTSACQTNKSA